MSEDKITRLINSAIGLTAMVLCVPVAWIVCHEVTRSPQGDEAVILTKDGTVSAQWNYQQLPMKECKWCGRRVNLNRHHLVPQAANPALRDVRENLIVLCRDCHFVLGHRCDWKQYNPDVMYIATHFTNCVRSADTRYGITNRPPVSAEPKVPDARGILHVTNEVPPEQRSALERILKWNPESPSRSTP